MTVVDHGTKLDLFDDRAEIELAAHVAVIKALGKRVVADVIEIGARLTDCRRILKEENRWEGWLKDEFGWARVTAWNFIKVYELGAQHSNFEHIDLPISALYLLAAPSTPAETRDTVLDLAANGEHLTLDQVKDMIAEAKRETAAESAEERAAALAKAEERAQRIEASFAEREKQIRQEYEGLLSLDEVQQEIDNRLQPLKKKLERAQKEIERLQKPPKAHEKFGTAPVAIHLALEHLAAKLLLTPEDVIAHQQTITDITGQSMKEGLAESLANAKRVLPWLERFIVLAEENNGQVSSTRTDT